MSSTGEITGIGAIFVGMHVLAIIARGFLTPIARRLAVRWGATQPEKIDKFGNAGYRLVVHLVGLMTHYMNGNVIERSYADLVPGVSTPTDRMLYIPAVVWSAIGAWDTVAAARKAGTPGEGADMIAHHVMTIALIIVSWLGGMQSYGAVLLTVHAIAEPFIDVYRLANSVPATPTVLVALANTGAATVFPYTRCVTFWYKCVYPMIQIPFDNAPVIGCHLFMWPMFILQIVWSAYMVKLLLLKIAETIGLKKKSSSSSQQKKHK